MAKLLWRRRLKSAAWHSLIAWTSGCSALALAGGLVAFGRDGRVWTYALTVVGGALGLWWAGFGRGR